MGLIVNSRQRQWGLLKERCEDWGSSSSAHAWGQSNRYSIATPGKHWTHASDTSQSMSIHVCSRHQQWAHLVYEDEMVVTLNYTIMGLLVSSPYLCGKMSLKNWLNFSIRILHRPCIWGSVRRPPAGPRLPTIDWVVDWRTLGIPLWDSLSSFVKWRWW